MRASAIHGDLPQHKRERALAQFSDGSRPVLVATDVAARGIHVDDVQAVVHYDPPEDQTADPPSEARETASTSPPTRN